MDAQMHLGKSLSIRFWLWSRVHLIYNKFLGTITNTLSSAC